MALVDDSHSMGSLRKRGRVETEEVAVLAVLERERLEVIIIG